MNSLPMLRHKLLSSFAAETHSTQETIMSISPPAEPVPAESKGEPGSLCKLLVRNLAGVGALAP